MTPVAIYGFVLIYLAIGMGICWLVGKAVLLIVRGTLFILNHVGKP